MIFGLFKNKQGQLMLEETFRTLSKASEQPKKIRKEIAKFVLEMIELYMRELEGLKFPSKEADDILKIQGNEATSMRQQAIGPLEDNDPEWLKAAILENFTFFNIGTLGRKESKDGISLIMNWIKINAPEEFKKLEKKLKI